jgi:hypothetical protein
MDPSIIIETPIPIKNLGIFVTYSLGCNIIWALLSHLFGPNSSKSFSIMNTVQLVGQATMGIYMSFILCGVHPMYYPKQTILASFYVGVNIIFPLFFFICEEETNSSTDGFKEHQMNSTEGISYLFSYLTGPERHKVTSKTRVLHQYTTFGATIGMVTTAILRILDHGMQIQRYPIPIVLGFTIGRCGGVILGALIAFCTR